mmetsp:Transcript_16021/g.20938  ORF Transcript_16021/g.20938 Transcript_16021/m.20938 type:complete len:548 (+) Transcript_16021:181-1824(+)|eukprot:CAMPEP_0198152860 /NCGR_PEP_ID=MMETSP1443-20131203/61520_1 /TAXON_ID=186043 /ORGANISM="Entomoneis sp., Strain CCMP2396" /LENGTH=547 /DNA_ID=CAMNT_0043818993 /DNA_START=70 /DNA_END=1713 /DNA_ORIENTATION=+
MASESAEPVVVITDEAAPATDAGVKEPRGGGGKNNNNNKKKGGPRPKREHAPVEELYDLSKPIPKTEKPNKDEHDKQVKELSDVIEVLHNKRKAIQEKIESSMDDPTTKSKQSELRSSLGSKRSKKGSLIKEKQAIRADLNRIKNDNEKIVKEKKDARSNVKFSSVEEINKEIRSLERQQETTSMSLSAEKILIKEIDALKASKKFFGEIKNKDAAMDDIRVQRKTLSEQISAKDKEIDAVSAELDKLVAELDVFNKTDQVKRDNIKGLFTERDAIKKEIGVKIAEKDAIRDTFHDQNNAWYDYQRAVKAQKKIQYDEEKVQREAENAEYEAKVKAEEEKKIPYEEEQALCDFLANFLERTYVGSQPETKISEAKEAAGSTVDDPFAGMKATTKKDDDEYFGKGKGKKKRVRSGKKQDSVAGPFTLSVDMFEQFGLIQLDPPTSVEQVAKSIEDLRAKKEYYSKQPRGSVKTAVQIRKELEKKDNKGKQQTSAPKKKTFGGLSKDDFLPLGAGASSLPVVASSSWGKSSAPPPPAETLASTPPQEAF